MAIQEITSPPMLDSTGQTIVTKLQNIASAINSNAGAISYDNTISGMTATKVQSAIDEVKGITDTISSSLTQKINIAVLTTLLDISYSDPQSLGYRTTETTKVDITTLSGYPTGKTYVGAVAQAMDIYGCIVYIDGSKYLRGTKKASGNTDVRIYVFYKD